MSDWGLLDMRAALDAGAARAQGLPVVTFGHSVGGQFLGLLANHRLARAHVQIATSVGYWRWEHAPFRYLAWWFWRVHGPLMLALKGYIPTGGGWAGLPLPRGVYEEWRRWCLRPDHFGPDLATYLAANVFAEIRAPLLSVGFTDDPIATRRTVEALNWLLPERGARVAVVHARRCRVETHRSRRVLRLEASRHAVASGDRLDRRQTGARGMSDPEVGQPRRARGSHHALRPARTR